jgi:glycosyltransferase involved in cell wall biosynthesis
MRPAAQPAQRTALIVAGMHRSGTSATTRILNLLGAQLADELIPADIGNARGHWESRAVQALHNRLLATLGSDLYSPVNFPDAWFGSSEARQWVDGLRDLIAAEYPTTDLFVLKDPRIALFLPLWCEALRLSAIVPRFVLPFRHPAAVAASLEKRERQLASGNALPPAQGAAVWLRYVLASERFTRGHLRSFVAFERLRADWRGEFARVGEQLGLAWPQWQQAQAAIDAFVDGADHGDESAAAADIIGPCREVYASLQEAVAAPQSVLPAFDAAAQALAAAQDLFGAHILARERVFDDLRQRADSAAQRQDSERADMHARFALEISARDTRIAAATAHASGLEATLAAREQERDQALDYARSLEQQRREAADYAASLEQQRSEAVDYAKSLQQERSAALRYVETLARERELAVEHAAAREQGQVATQAALVADIALRDARLAEAAENARRLDETIALLQREHGNASDYARALALDRDRAVDYARSLEQSRDETLAYALSLEQARDAATQQTRAVMLARSGLPVFFTIASRNYLAYAITLMQSVAAQYPDAPRYLILADRDEGDAALAGAPFETIAAATLALPDFDAFAFRYTIMEFNTAIKPYAFAHLRRRHADAGIVYLDPDILLTGPLTEVEAAFADGALAVLTPHLLAPVDDDCQPGERDILLSGTYNCGFVAIGAHAGFDRLVGWWAERLEFGALSDIAAGLFTDQKWIDLVPGLFPDVRILRDEGYNLAYWNLSQRPVTQHGPYWYAAGQRLAFVHFSGVDIDRPAEFSRHQNRHTRATIGKLRPLHDDYLARLAANGHAEHRGKPYAYGRFADGEPICAAVRAVYRRYFDKGTAQPQRDPFSMDRQLYDLPCDELPARADAPITRVMYAAWNLRADLRQAFDLDQAAGRRGFIRWFARAAQREMGIPQRHLEPARRTLEVYEADDAPDSTSVAGRLNPARSAASACLDLVNWSYRFALAQRCYALVPQRTRDRVRQRLERIAARPAAVAPAAGAAQQPGINLVGYAHGEFGVAEVLRRYAHALHGGAVPFIVRNFDTGVASRQADRSMQRFMSAECRYDVNLFCINADQMPVAREQLGDAVFGGRYNIGCWFWELEKFPAQWHGAIDIVDEIWVTSPFVRAAIAACTDKPVHIVPIALAADLPARWSRSAFGLAEGVFLCLFSFDFNSFAVRKNAEGVIAAFRRAFDDGRRDVRLVIKTTNGARFPQALQRLRAVAASDDRIEVRDGFLDRRGMWALQACCDCYVSLHRSEGLGLGMAECMLLGKPVVATAYSGNLAFMDSDNSCLVGYSLVPVEEGEYPDWQGQHWAEPDIAQAAAYLLRLADDPLYARQIGDNAKASVSRRLSVTASAAAVRARLADIHAQRAG